jgi:PAS domain S-box-containing protein
MIEDITRRKEAEEALRRAKEEYQILVENQSELICKSDLDGRLLFASNSYCETYGLDPAAPLQGRPWMPTVHEDDRAEVQRNWEATLHPPFASDSEQRAMTIYGWRSQAWSNHAVLGEDGKPVAIVSVGRDITERKRLESELRDSEERYRRLVQSAPVPMTVFRRGRIAFINAAGLALLGVAREDDVIGKRVRTFIHPEDAERVGRAFREAQRARHDSVLLPFRLVRPDGDVRFVQAVGTELDYLGTPALQTVIRDVTEERRAQAALVESEDRFRKLAEASFEGILFHDDGQILETNSHLLQMFGWEAADLAGKSLTDLVAPEHVEFIERRIRARYSDSYEVRGRRKDGSVFPLEVLDRAINWQGRQVRVAALRDISQRREMEYALRESEERYRRLVQESPSAIFVTSEGRIVFANRAAMALFDARQEEEVIGLAYIELIAPESRREVEAALTRMTRLTTDFPTLQYKLLRRDRNTVEVEGRPISFTFQGRDSVLHVSYDITERKRAEELVRRHSEELERLVAERTAQIQKLERLRLESEKQVAIGRMAARIAHEINNPLAGIKNSFLLVKRGIDPDFKYYDFVGRIEKEIERVARIVRQMFELYRPERKEPTQFRPADVIRDVAALLEGNCRNQGVSIDLDAAAAQAAVLLHEDSLRQVLFNLVQNAIEASPTGRRIHVTATASPLDLTVAVRDEGCGIPEDVQSRIFEPFFTTKSGLTTGGLGLGLSTTKGLVEAMGGTLTYESVVGQGTTFQFTLPLSVEQPEVTHA